MSHGATQRLSFNGAPARPACRRHGREPVLARQRADLRVKRYATHPVNAMLNAVFSVTAGRLVAALHAAGAHPAIGFLHADKPGRWSLAWDAIEPLRPSIEADVFAFIRRHQFSGGDFIRVHDARGSIRLGSNLLRVVIADCAPSRSAFERRRPMDD